MLYTLPVNARDVGDGDGFTAYVDTADPREATDVPQEVHEALSARDHTRRPQNYQIIDDAGYKVVNGSINGELLVKKYRIRMRGIDAPELEMEYGKESRNELANLIGGKCVRIYVYEKDQFERYVGDIYCNDMFIQEEMLKRGFAWHFEFYDKRLEFGQWEREARAARRGLWLSNNPEKPWEWRRDRRNAKKQDGIQMDNGSCEALSRTIKEKKNAEENAREWKKECESAIAENQMLKDLLRESKKALQNEKEGKQRIKDALQNEKKGKQRLKQMAIWVGTSMLIFGIAVLYKKCKTPPKKKGVALLYHYVKNRI